MNHLISEKMKMKFKNIQFFALLMLMVFAMTACKPEEIVLDPPPSKLEGINGTFVLSEVIQQDPFILGDGATLDVTAIFTTGTAPTITFDSGAFTFSYAKGDGPDYLGAAGSWAFDNDDYPTQINMNNGLSQYALKLRHTIRPQDEYLEVNFERGCGGNPTVVYQFKFARLQ